MTHLVTYSLMREPQVWPHLSEEDLIFTLQLVLSFLNESKYHKLGLI